MVVNGADKFDLFMYDLNSSPSFSGLRPIQAFQVPLHSLPSQQQHPLCKSGWSIKNLCIANLGASGACTGGTEQDAPKAEPDGRKRSLRC